jgi:hypothetical protein
MGKTCGTHGDEECKIRMEKTVDRGTVEGIILETVMC